ncbi:hypothetical protein MASR1M66_04240 [Aminivibrio sp.]
MRLTEASGIELAGKEAVVIGRSNIVGKPVALMLLAKRNSHRLPQPHPGDTDAHGNRRIFSAAVGRPSSSPPTW